MLCVARKELCQASLWAGDIGEADYQQFKNSIRMLQKERAT